MNKNYFFNIANQQSKNNPIMANAMRMYNSGDENGLEQLVRNVCKEKGINIDDMLSKVKKEYSR